MARRVRLPAGFKQVSEESLDRLARVAERGSLRRLKKLYQQAHDELEGKLGRLSGRAAR